MACFRDDFRQPIGKPIEATPGGAVWQGTSEHLEGVLGDEQSAVDESHSEAGRLEYPQYTRPREFRGMTVPDILLSGDHGKIRAWREAESKRRTARRRPDLIERRKS